MSTKKLIAVLTALGLTLSACGGGGGGSEPNAPTPPAGNVAPVVSSVGDQSVDEDGIAGPIGFSVSDAETDASVLEVSALSSNQALLPDDAIDVLGDGADRFLVLIPNPDQIGATEVTIAVTDADGLTTETRFQLDVEARFRGEFSTWVRDVPLMQGEFDTPSGALHDDGGPIAEVEDVGRIKFTDASADNPAAYDDLLPAEDEVFDDDV